MLQITRRFEFDAGHRVLGHEGKCRHLHGHHYIAEVTVTAPELDQLGRVIDFSVLKERVGRWIDGSWDHALLLNGDDPQRLHFERTEERVRFLSNGINPTAENLAIILFITAQGMMKEVGIRVTHVRLYETPNCFADYSGE